MKKKIPNVLPKAVILGYRYTLLFCVKEIHLNYFYLTDVFKLRSIVVIHLRNLHNIYIILGKSVVCNSLPDNVTSA